ncbi:MAG: hypothetical protein IT260_08040, partial [Saprospiraceae bacterium]|nr:hypothetical protein [Saprospiraceae bacterium]
MNKFYKLNFAMQGAGKACLRMMLLTGLMAATVGINLLQAQVNVTSTGGTPMAGYTTLSAAITAINAGTHTGTIVVDVNAGHTETLTGRINLTATGTAADPITIQKSGAGANPVLSSYTGVNTPTSNERDGMFSLSGSDWVTIDGIDLQEAAGNTDATTTMEYGYGLFKASDVDGCQNNTIKNCVVTLNRVNNATWTGNGHNGSIGITVNNCTALVNTSITPTAATGSNSFNKFYSNTIQNCNAGISFTAYAAPSPFTLGDTGNDVGGASAATGNTILNFGGGAGATNPATGVFANNQWGFNCSRNTINNNDGGGVNHVNVLRGIFMNASSASASADCNFNTISLKGGGTTSQLTGIENGFGSTAAGNTININNNTITNCTYTTATSGVFYGIYNNAATPANLNINNNTFSNNSTAATSGSYYPYYNTGAVTTSLSVSNNSINGVSFTAAATSLIFRSIYITTAASASAQTVSNNTFQSYSYAGTASGEFAFIYAAGTAASYTISGNSASGISIPTTSTAYQIYNSTSTPNTTITNNALTGFSKTGAGGTVYGYYNFGSPSGGTATLSGNTVSNITVTGATTVYGLYQATSTTQVEKLLNNTVSNITGGTSTIFGIHHNYGAVGSENSGNTVSGLSGAGIVTGIQIGNSTASLGMSMFNNTVSGLSSTGASAVNGIIHTSGNATNMFKNKVYNLQANNAGGTVFGISITGGLSVTVYNNLVGELTAPISSGNDAVRGISVSSSTANSAVNVYYNTVYLNATSTGVNFGSSAVFHTVSATATTAVLTLRNNIFVNTSTPAGTGATVAYRRSGTALNNYGSASNNNLFYAGTPGAANLIFTDGTNADQMLSAYKTRVAPLDANSVTENPSFLSTTGASADFLHLNAAVPTQAESAATNIAGITTDYDDVVRQGNGGYAGTGSSPDLGADEGEFILVDLTGPAISYTNIANSVCVSSLTLNATITDATGVNTSAGTKPRIWFKKSTENNELPATNTAADNGWKYVEASNASSPFSFTIDYSLLTSAVVNGDVIEYFVVAQDLISPANVGTNAANYAAGFTPASVALAAGAFPVTNPRSYSIIASPVTITTVASRTTLCISENVTLSLTGSVTTGAEYQWQSSPAGANNWTSIPGANGPSYSAVAVNSSTDYRCVVSCGGTPVAASPSTPVSVTVNSPALLSTTPGTECGPGPVAVTLGATANAGSTINWFAALTGGLSLGTGTSFVTPPISATTTYYAEASTGGGTEQAGKPTYVTTANTIGSAWGLVFNVVNAPITLQTVDVYAVGATTGTISVQLTDNAGTVLQTAGPFAFPTGTVAAPVTVTLPLNFTVPIGTGYRLLSASASGGALIRETSGIAYPYTSASTNVVVTSGYIGGTTASTYYWFYNWQVSSGCAAARTPVTATVVTDPPTCPSNTSVCVNAAAFTLSGGLPAGGTYSGNGVSGDQFDPSAAGVGTHTITYTSCALACTFQITVNPLPAAAISIAETSGTTNNDGLLCAGATATLMASGGGTYLWSTNETTAEISVSSTGTYQVTVTSADGCVASTSV